MTRRNDHALGSARAARLVAPLLLALGGCFADPGPDDSTIALSTSTDAISTTDGGTGSTGSTGGTGGSGGTGNAGATTTVADISTTGVDGTTTDEIATTGVGTTTSAEAPCSGPADCGEGEFCDFPDLLCGDAEVGACQPRPTRCAPTTPTYGCNCELYESACHAQQAGVDALGLIVECL